MHIYIQRLSSAYR